MFPVSRMARSSSERRGIEREEVARVEFPSSSRSSPQSHRTDRAGSRLPSYRLTDESINDSESVMVAIDESTATGVSFALTEEQKELRRLALDFAAKEEIRPLEAECDAVLRGIPRS